MTLAYQPATSNGQRATHARTIRKMANAAKLAGAAVTHLNTFQIYTNYFCKQNQITPQSIKLATFLKIEIVKIIKQKLFINLNRLQIMKCQNFFDSLFKNMTCKS